MQDPLSIRVDRPYANEEAFLEAEAWSVNVRSMLLIDVESIPEGTALRCELRLSNGHALIVAEGYAVKHLSATATRPSGLVVRYKRMSAASTEFVKRAVACNTESKAGSSPSAVQPPASSQQRTPEASSAPSVRPPQSPSAPPRTPSVRPPQTPSAPPRTPSVRPPQTPSVPPRAPSAGPSQAPSGTPAPRPSRSPSAQPSMKPPVPARKSSKPPSLTPPRRTPVLPSAIRASTIPPSIARRSGAPQSSASEPDNRTSLRPLEGDASAFARRSGSAYVDTHPSDQTRRGANEYGSKATNGSSASVPPSIHDHDTAAMQRLRSRIPTRAISAPPDRETVLSRLKNKPSA